MRIKSALAVLSLSFVCLASRVSFADTLQLSSVGGASADGVYTYPYNMTFTPTGGSSITEAMSCLSFDREIVTGESWTVQAYNVLSIPAGALGGFTANQFIEDALLFNQYPGADAQKTLDIQFAIWSIMADPSLTSGNTSGAFNLNAYNLAQAATLAVTGSTPLDKAQFANDEVYIPVSGTQSTGGLPQIFMGDAPAVTPEPSSLILLGTGLFGTVGIMRRKLRKA